MHDHAESSQNDDLGANAWLVDELREQWRADRMSVDASWRALFEKDAVSEPSSSDASAATNKTSQSTSAKSTPRHGTDASTRPATGRPSHPAADAPTRPATGAPTRPAASASTRPSPSAPTPTRPTSAPTRTSARPRTRTSANGETGEAIRGVGARIVANMEASLAVPTATSFREIPAKLLEVNRQILNGHLGRKLGDKVSFTHLIGYAVVKAIADTVPAMNNTFTTDSKGRPRLIRNQHIGLGLAVDLPKSDGTRTLMVPVIRDADTLDFHDFVDRYNGQVDKVRTGKVTAHDFAGVTVTLTNPGTLGTRQSVPRLMSGQSTIVGVGALAFPAEYQAADPARLADLGVSKLVTITSTYDHRVIQGAESGLFLRQVHNLLLGRDGFYNEVFQAMSIPYEPVKWRLDFNPADRDSVMLTKQSTVNQLINQYRVRGHLIADLNPLRVKAPRMHAELDPANYGLTIWDLDREFLTGSKTGIYAMVGGRERMALGDLLGVLRDAYCRSVGVEYMHIQNPHEKRWIQEQIEGADTSLKHDEQLHILGQLNAAEALSSFLNSKYVGQKRFGLEGAESAIPLLDALLAEAADSELVSVVMGMAHRGRLNVLVNLAGKSYQELFREFEGAITEAQSQGSGDVKYHLGQHGVYTSPSGSTIEVDLAANPSHLEAVDPVVVGMARARMDLISYHAGLGPFPVLPLLVHGDAAFAGQGVVAETFNLSQIKGYRVGGTIHVVINNQLGFTTTPEVARSSEYSTDVAKMVGAPIFHVNGDDPEACVRVARLAFAYRQEFSKDAVIDMICYRRYGHSETDDPSYTLPEMYRRINAKPTVREQYTSALIKRGDLTPSEADDAIDDFRAHLQRALDETRDHAAPEGLRARPAPTPMGMLPHVRTSIDAVTVKRIYEALRTLPDGFTLHPKLARQFKQRDEMFNAGEIDWALGEAMAFGSLLMEGTSVRLSGQDSRRGTFSHRHSTLVDYNTTDEYTPLASLRTDKSDLYVYDSLLSEYAVLGFEYGYATATPEALVIWEAQFGDFANGAQIIFDQFIMAAEDKWQQRCGIVVLLPHGYEGQGPEHSSARVERFLLLAAEDNVHICNATTAAQFFHLLRRQMIQDARKPLIVFTPKSLLRARASRSSLHDLMSGTFEEVLDDIAVTNGTLDPGGVRRVILCSGKIAYDLMAARDQRSLPIAVCRVEQLYPWPFAAIDLHLRRYRNASELVWVQEEPENMGPWNAVKGRLYEAHEGTHRIRRVSRPESGSPACGSARIHAQEHEDLLEAALAS